jgi:sulfhydrogenase subunit alpha
MPERMRSERKAKHMSKNIAVDYLARVEGEGGLNVKMKGGTVEDVHLRIFEPPRFFEAFLRGRNYAEAPDITARICGICPVAYQMSSTHAMENVFGAEIDGGIRALRRLLYCGEWIESHALHIYLLHAPDFLGYDDAIQMAKDHAEVVTKGLQLKKIGNDIVALIGGREIHPINVKVGGFYSVPTKRELKGLLDPLLRARDTSVETVRWTATLPFPEFERPYEFVSLRHPTEYPMNEGRVVSSDGLDIPVQEFEQYFVEEHVEHSNALHSIIKNRGPYFVGPMARFALNFDRLTPLARELSLEVGLSPSNRNPFKSIIVRAVETLCACEEAVRLIEEYEQPDASFIAVEPREGRGYGCTEAPRGILYHRYSLDAKGIILDAKIVPPTSQNQKTIENDIRDFVAAHIHLPHDQLTWQCEQAIRNYDPCISCATHFLKLDISHA